MRIDDDILKLIDELEALRETRNDHWQIPRAEGEVLYQVALSVRARTVVELGTSYGFSGLFWGAALRRTGGTLHTVDNDPKKVESSRETFRRAGLAGTVVNHQGDAADVAASIPGPIDIAFIDACDKPLAVRYFDILWPKIRAGGSVFTDNVATHRAELAGYVGYVRGLDGASSTEIPVGNGVEWTIKLG